MVQKVNVNVENKDAQNYLYSGAASWTIFALAPEAPRMAVHLYSGLLWEPKPQETQFPPLWGLFLEFDWEETVPPSVSQSCHNWHFLMEQFCTIGDCPVHYEVPTKFQGCSTVTVILLIRTHARTHTTQFPMLPGGVAWPLVESHWAGSAPTCLRTRSPKG